MRIVFMGTPEFAVRQLVELLSAGHEVTLVVTAPERPAGRGRKPARSAVEKAALEVGLKVITPEDVNIPEVLEQIAWARPDVIVVAAFGQKLGKALLTIPRLGCFNVHASLLPRYRGAAPINRAIINGDEVTGVTIQSIAPRIDRGAIAGQKEVRIDPTWNVTPLANRLAETGAGLLREVLAQLEAGKLELREQPSEGASYAPRLSKSDGIIDWSRSATNIHNLVRGVTPWPGAQTWRTDSDGHKLQLLLTETAIIEDERSRGEPGEVVGVTDAGIDVACGAGVLRVMKLKPAGKREMTAAEFVHGHRWKVGDRLSDKT